MQCETKIKNNNINKKINLRVYFHSLPVIQSFLLVCFFFTPQQFSHVTSFTKTLLAHHLFTWVFPSPVSHPDTFILDSSAFKNNQFWWVCNGSNSKIGDGVQNLKSKNNALLCWFIKMFSTFPLSTSPYIFRIVRKLKPSHTVYFMIRVIIYDL